MNDPLRRVFRPRCTVYVILIVNAIGLLRAACAVPALYSASAKRPRCKDAYIDPAVRIY